MSERFTNGVLERVYTLSKEYLTTAHVNGFQITEGGTYSLTTFTLQGARKPKVRVVISRVSFDTTRNELCVWWGAGQNEWFMRDGNTMSFTNPAVVFSE